MITLLIMFTLPMAEDKNKNGTLDTIFGGDPTFTLLDPFKDKLGIVFTAIMGVGLVCAVGAFALNGFKFTFAGDSIQKSSSAMMGLRNVLFGLAILLIGLPFLIGFIGATTSLV
jgi:hypothetical protein